MGNCTVGSEYCRVDIVSALDDPYYQAERIAQERALVRYVAYFKLANHPRPSAKTIARLGLSVGMNVASAERIYKKADELAERMRGTIVEKAAANGDAATAIALMDREESATRSKPNVAAKPNRHLLDNILFVAIWPIMAIQAVCAFLLVCTCNVLVAIAKTFKGEDVR